MVAAHELLEKIRRLPQQPGVYQFFDQHKRLLYIGKATHLRSRVSSYFRSSTQHSAAKQFMVSQIVDIHTTVVDTEPEALLLETTLIKKYKPPYNVVMKDDKNFQYIHITDEAFPRIETTRHLPLTKRTGWYFGPYVSGYDVRNTMRLLKGIFRFCSHPPETKRGVIVIPKRPCLEFHLGRCVGPCAGEVSQEEYQRIFERVIDFLKGDYEPIEQQLRATMKEAVQAEQFEKAARVRDQLASIQSLMTEQKVVSTRSDNADYMSLARLDGTAAMNVFVVRKGKLIHQQVFFLKHTTEKTDEEIVEAFTDQYYSQTIDKPHDVYTSVEARKGRHRKMLEMGTVNADEALNAYVLSQEKKERSAQEGVKELARAIGLDAAHMHRIETYDISNIQGRYPVGSMIVFVDGLPKTSEYRKFKIKTVEGPNDFASLREVMNRRVRHLPAHAKEHTAPWPRPDLIIIDGGKGQLSAAKTMLDAAGVDIPIISLAKREEELFVPGYSEPVRLPEGSTGYHLIQRMRDEAHRFAIGFYRSRHLKGLV